MAEYQPEEIARARADLSRFTPAAPLFVPPRVLAQLKTIPDLADLMDRVRATVLIP